MNFSLNSVHISKGAVSANVLAATALTHEMKGTGTSSLFSLLLTLDAAGSTSTEFAFIA